MPAQRTLLLSPKQRQQLLELRDHHQKPYLRERAAALLKVAQGFSAHWVSQFGLLRKRAPDTVYAWLDRYEANGIEGLFIEEGRGRKPAFSP